MQLWGSLYLQSWQRKEAEIVQRWGMRDFLEREPPRSNFKGEMREVDLLGDCFSVPLTLNPDGRERYFPATSKWKRMIVGAPIIFFMIVVVIVFTVCTMYSRTVLVNAGVDLHSVYV
ncbi:hypothetical protein CYMTET_36327, partial [Cymbomonas tetramitiformis]